MDGGGGKGLVMMRSGSRVNLGGRREDGGPRQGEKGKERKEKEREVRVM